MFAQENSDCFMCHGDKAATGKRNGKIVSIFVDEKKIGSSVHGKVLCISCHVDLKDSDFPHKEKLAPAQCGGCHQDAKKLYDEGIHGKAYAKKDPLAPNCQNCHGAHEITKVKDKNSAVYALKIPYLCGKCHKEGTPVQLQRNIPQDHILENYSESIHGEGLLKKGLAVSATCASCHSPHRILPHTDPRSTIARKNIAATCTTCHVAIEAVHRKIIRGELWEKEANKLPACVDCHQPHKARKMFYDNGMANQDCMRCHGNPGLKSAVDGRTMFVDEAMIADSKHKKIACSQCHSEVNNSKIRPCETITKKVDCSSCHSEIGEIYKTGIHGQLVAKNDKDAPRCADCHGTHGILGKADPRSPVFPTNVPILCGNCHREGHKAALRYNGKQHDIIDNYYKSTHGRALTTSGLTVTATCASCHSAHHELPKEDPKSSVYKENIATTCGTCHKGIAEQFLKGVHSALNTKTDKELPNCASCHTAHQIQRTADSKFALNSIRNCGSCHEKSLESFFDTYHGKVSLLGYTETAKCYNCHGAHDVFRIEDVRSRVSRKNILNTCQTCHPGAPRRFAGYLSHATHHDPVKYPFLFWTFWGMTGLLIGTFIIAGAHTILWLPRSLQWKRKLKELEEEEEKQERLDEEKNEDEDNE